MPVTPSVPARLLAGPFRGTEAVARGLLTPDQLRSSCWRRVFRDVYVASANRDDVAVRVAAAALLLPAGAALSGRSAAWVHGVDVRGHREPVEATVPRGTHWSSRPGLRVREAALPEDDMTLVRDVPATTPLRTAFDLARRKPFVEGVVAVDAFRHAGLVDAATLLRYTSAPEHRGWCGIRSVPEVVRLSSPLSESPMETRLRLLVVQAGLPTPELQVQVADAFGVVARIDLGYRDVRLGLEYDGRYHRDDSVYLADVRRENRLRALGWTILRFTGEDVYRRPGLVVAQTRAALADAA